MRRATATMRPRWGCSRSAPIRTSAESDGTTPLHWAVHHDDAELVRRLLEAGADVAVANDYGATPMSEAAVVGQRAVLDALLDAGADVDSPNADGQTALMVVARGGNTAAAKLLIERGAERQRARAAQGPDGADVGRRAEPARRWSSCLIANGAEVDARSTVNDWERMVTAEPRQKNLMPGGFTPLLYAARQGCLECAKSLIAAGAAVDLTDPDGVTPLISALLNAHFDTAKYLLEAGANVNKWDFWGRTPLYLAVDFNTLPHGGRPDRLSLDDTTNLADDRHPARGRRESERAAEVVSAVPQPAHGSRRRRDSRHRHDAAAARRARRGHRRDRAARGGRRAARLAAARRHHAADGRGRRGRELDRHARQVPHASSTRSRRPTRCSRPAPPSTSATRAAARRCTTRRPPATRTSRSGSSSAAPDLHVTDADGVTPLDAANGKLRGGRRGAGTAYPATAEALQGLLATTAAR